MNVNHMFQQQPLLLGIPLQQILLQQLQQAGTQNQLTSAQGQHHQHQGGLSQPQFVQPQLSQQPQQDGMYEGGYRGTAANGNGAPNFFPQQLLGLNNYSNQSQSFQHKFMPHNTNLPPHQQQNQHPPLGKNSSYPGQNKVASINVDDPSTMYWQHQVLLCQISRAENIPHFYARQFALNSRKTKNPYAEVKSVTLIDATKTIVTALEEREEQQRATQASQTPSALMRNKKTEVEDDEEQRMIARTKGKQLWCHLDLSGQGLSSLLPRLFQYDFLESLYLNNNKLTSIPPIIGRLRGLRVLDLSHNRITEIPPELGMCFKLRYLYLFDNYIKKLPYEFRNLIELLFLGIEGNPIELNIANLILERGTKALIGQFRDMEPSYPEPKPRQWLLLEDDGEVIDPVADPEKYAEDYLNKERSDSLTLMSYNILCQHYATPKMYKYTPTWALDWNYRKLLLKEEIMHYNTDVICLQEVETQTFHDFWTPIMNEAGFQGYFFSKTRSKTMSELELKKVDGCATFIRRSKFALVLKQHLEYNTVCMGLDRYKKTKDLFNRFMNKDHVALITQLEHLESKEKILVVNTHLHWDPAYNDVKALQVGILLEELQNIIRKSPGGSDDYKNIAMIICGDFNSTKLSAVYQLFSTGVVHKHEDIEGRDYGRFTDDGFVHNFKLKSAYDHIASTFPFSNYTPTFTNEIDYVWYSTNTLKVKGLLGKADQEYFEHHIGIPNAHFPSDHIPLVTKFQIRSKASASGTKKPEFKPDLKAGSSRKT